MIRIIFVLFFLLIISTFLIWLSIARDQENNIKNFISKNLEEEYDLIYTLETTGFPNRVDTKIRDIKLISKTNYELISIESLLIMSLIYNRKKYVISIQPPINIKLKPNSFEIITGKIEASIKYFNNKSLKNFTLHAIDIHSNLNNKFSFKLNDLLFATRSTKNNLETRNNDFFLKLEKLKLENNYIDENKIFDFKFSLNDPKSLNLPNILKNNEFIANNFDFTHGNIEIIDTNIDLNNTLITIKKYWDEQFINYSK